MLGDKHLSIGLLDFVGKRIDEIVTFRDSLFNSGFQDFVVRKKFFQRFGHIPDESFNSVVEKGC